MVFVILAFAGGMGIVLYAAFWAVLPLTLQDPDADTSAARAADTTRLLALAAVVVGIGLLLTAVGVTVVTGAVVPIIVAVVGAALIWRQTDDEQRDAWSRRPVAPPVRPPARRPAPGAGGSSSASAWSCWP